MSVCKTCGKSVIEGFEFCSKECFYKYGLEAKLERLRKEYETKMNAFRSALEAKDFDKAIKMYEDALNSSDED